MNEIQSKILEIYIEIKRVCDQNNIRFFAIGGTAIGAERHNGFIPWDDDLDIAIPNTDYARFLDHCAKELPSYLKIFDYHDSKHSLIFWNKVHDNRTAFLEKSTLKYDDYHYGVFVDVMPMYGVPEDIKSYNKKIKKYRMCNSIKQNAFGQLSSYKWKIAKALMLPINVFLPRTFWLKKLDEYQSQWKFDESENVGYTWRYIKKNIIFKREWFANYYEVDFESTKMRCCKGNREMLSTQFGNFMILPPECQRVSTHLVEIVDLDHSYDEYDCKGELKNE